MEDEQKKEAEKQKKEEELLAKVNFFFNIQMKINPKEMFLQMSDKYS